MLFQVATTTALALDNQDQAIFSFRNHHAGQGHSPTRYRTTIFRNLSETSWWVRKRRPKKRHSYAEKHFHYAPIPYQPHLKLDGYFQSEKYFTHYHTFLRQLFRPTDEQTEYLAEEYGSLLGEMPTSLHVRRGDYAKLTDFHPTLTLDYYQRALEMVPLAAPRTGLQRRNRLVQRDVQRFTVPVRIRAKRGTGNLLDVNVPKPHHRKLVIFVVGRLARW